MVEISQKGEAVRHLLGMTVVLAVSCGIGFGAYAGSKGGNPVVLLETSMGNIKVELEPEKAPVSTKNFLAYVNAGYYDGLIFHRVIKNFMIQGGGFSKEMREKHPGHPPIRNEAGNGLKNERGTIAMARTNVVDSATSQFFINVANNDFLNHVDDTPRGYGYAVFGRVIEGMDVVDKIQSVPTGRVSMFQDVPKETVTIIKATIVQK